MQASRRRPEGGGDPLPACQNCPAPSRIPSGPSIYYVFNPFKSRDNRSVFPGLFACSRSVARGRKRSKKSPRRRAFLTNSSFFIKKAIKLLKLIKAAQKGPDARPQLNRGATNEAYSLPYAAVRSDEDNAADGPFSAACLPSFFWSSPLPSSYNQ